MKFAVIKTGGKQYIVEEGQTIKIEKLAGQEGDKVEFKEVLLVADDQGGSFDLGKPLAKSKVSATISKHGKDDKVTVIKYKPKTRYRRKQGHRQQYTKVKIDSIS